MKECERVKHGGGRVNRRGRRGGGASRGGGGAEEGENVDGVEGGEIGGEEGEGRVRGKRRRRREIDFFEETAVAAGAEEVVGRVGEGDCTVALVAEVVFLIG
ncbi:hypothetical protein RND81_04G024500 [Saponaria officinalis]|uniref:Uncharacterized protein n=1 Tax=Saponaria officinalis TaxID=3572 RepID=A0AAW1LEE1_SAPOF